MKLNRLGRISPHVILGIAALLILILRITPAQSPTPLIIPPTTTIKVATRLVTVDVVALDNKGRQVQGLTKDDFELREDDKLQPISVFSVEGSLIPHAPLVAAPQAPIPPPTPLATLPLNTFTNRPALPSAAPTSATVILMDGLNTRPQDLAWARGQVAKFLAQLQAPDVVALYALGGTLRVAQDFTSDSALLFKAFDKLNPHQGAENLEPADPQSGPATMNLARTSVEVGPGPDLSQNTKAFRRQDMTFNALSAIGQHLAHVRGRKTLIWISYGIPLIIVTIPPPHSLAPPDIYEYTPQVRSVSRLLSNYNVAVYPIDARGTFAGVSGTAYDAESNNADGMAISTHGAMKGALNRDDASRLFAQLTGGRMVSSGDVGAAIRTAMDDSKLTYVLGYYPSPDESDSKFHTFKVRVNRSGVKLLYRGGYLAVNEQNQTPEDQDKLVAAALQSPLDCTEIGLRAQLQKAGAANAPPLTLNLTVDVGDLPLSHNQDRWQGELEVVIEQHVAGGDVISESARKHSVKLNLEDSYYTQLKSQGLLLYFPFTPVPQAGELKVVVREINSGAMGSVHIPMDKTLGG
ncbi:MAG: VWA domain-containing protein [Terriglobia bacterium]|jgi:VWFA-related protein